jgi:hypothetical protein
MFGTYEYFAAVSPFSKSIIIARLGSGEPSEWRYEFAGHAVVMGEKRFG